MLSCLEAAQLNPYMLYTIITCTHCFVYLLSSLILAAIGHWWQSEDNKQSVKPKKEVVISCSPWLLCLPWSFGAVMSQCGYNACVAMHWIDT